MFTPTGDYPNISMPNLGNRFLNRLSHTASLKITELTSSLGFEQVRRRAGLPKRKLYSPFKDSPPRPRTPILCAWSPSLIPPSSDWHPRVQVTGYYFFPYSDSYTPPNELNRYLESGKPPVCVSFGSMVNKNAEKIDVIIRDALKKTDKRGIILSGWGSAKRESTSDLMYLDSVPHDWLLPKCKLLIHHGGAGTTSAGLRAGIPQVVVPFMADQPFWGSRVHAIGVGPKPVRVNQLSVGMMVSAIDEAETKVILERAQVIGQEIRGEDGVGNAVKLIESYAVEFGESV
jgi:sterol 3beta-glucosyltransferase